MLCEHTHSLLDVMSVLPPLHPRELARSGVSTLRHLRLVSKEVGRLALSAVTSCTVHLGCGGCLPRPQQMALFAGAELQDLEVILTLESGGLACVKIHCGELIWGWIQSKLIGSSLTFEQPC